GVAWSSHTLGTIGSIGSAVWTGSKVVGVGGAVAASTASGATWTEKPNPATRYMNSIVYTGSGYIAAASHSVYTSPDAATLVWTRQGGGVDSYNSLYGVAWSGSQFVAVGYYNVATSLNGTSWTAVAAPPKAGLKSVAWNGAVYCAVGEEGAIFTSTNGTAWTARTSPGGKVDLNRVIWAGNQFVAVGGNINYPEKPPYIYSTSSIILTSPDGITWTRQTIPTGNIIRSVAWDGHTFVAVSDSSYSYNTLESINAVILVSTDGVHWNVSGTSLNGLSGIAYSGNTWVATGYGRTIQLSTDLTSWADATTVPLATTSTTSYVDADVYDLCWTGQEFIAVTGTGSALHSVDGDVWTERLTATHQRLNGIVFNGKMLVAVGDSSAVLSSGSGAPVIPAVNFTDATSSTGYEGGTKLIQVRLSSIPSAKVTVPFTVVGGDANTLVNGPLADATVSASPLIFNPGETIKYLTVMIKSDNRAEGNETLKFSLGLPTAIIGGTLGTVNPTHTFTVTDDDFFPTVTKPADMLVELGDPIVLSVTATGSGPVAYAWKRGTTALPAFKGPVLYIPVSKTSDGGAYTCTVTNAVTSITSDIGQVGVYSQVNAKNAVLGIADLTFTPAVGGNVNVTWTDGGTAITPPATGFVFSANQSTLTLKKPIVASHVLQSQITLTGISTTLVPTVDGDSYAVDVVTTLPALGNVTTPFPTSLPDAHIGVAYSLDLSQYNTGGLISTWSAGTSLPAGLTLNAATGIISGFATTATPATKPATVKITVTNGKGVASKTTTLAVVGLDPGLIGTSVGILDREPEVTRILGGRVTLSVLPNGTFTGSYLVGAVSQSFTGQAIALTSTTATGTALLVVDNKNVSVQFNYNASATPHSTIGTISISAPENPGGTPAQVSFSAVRAMPVADAAHYVGKHNFALDFSDSSNVGDINLPQGTGYGTASVDTKGVVTFTGKTRYGTTYTSSSFVGEGGDCPLYAILATTFPNAFSGSLQGWPHIALGSNPAPVAANGLLDNTIADADSTSTTCAEWVPHLSLGVPVLLPTELILSGARYNPPASKTVVMGLSVPVASGKFYASNATILLGGAGLDDVNTSVYPLAINAAGANLDPSTFYGFSVVPASGVFSGTISFSDYVNGVLILRPKMPYSGLIIPGRASGADQGVGVLMLRQLPDANISPQPPASSAPVLSGNVELDPQ
ncbi:MAG: hypothetical protein JWO94_2135, partial [Verrucomicrobiaceae bacterium]|nr:hypothetical protein [Verrucomicrobiaceae bacterium]